MVPVKTPLLFVIYSWAGGPPVIPIHWCYSNTCEPVLLSQQPCIALPHTPFCLQGQVECLSTLLPLRDCIFMMPFWTKGMILFQAGEGCLSSSFTAPQPSQSDSRAGEFLHSFGLVCFAPEANVFPSCAAETRLHLGKTQQESKAQTNSVAPELTLGLLHFSYLRS